MMKIKLLILLAATLISTNLFAYEELVMNAETAFIPTHHNRFSFLLGVNPSLTKAADITNFSFSFGKKMDEFWFDATASVTYGIFSKMTTNNPAATRLIDADVDLTKNSLLTIGAGLGRETRYSQTLMPYGNLYETIAADITYNSYKEKSSGRSFTGPGMLAKFSLFNKFSEYFSLGAQFTYNLAVVKRSAEFDTETSSARSLTMSHLTIGIDLSFYL